MPWKRVAQVGKLLYVLGSLLSGAVNTGSHETIFDSRFENQVTRGKTSQLRLFSMSKVSYGVPGTTSECARGVT